VLAVDQQPVEAGGGEQLRRVRIGEADPEADLRLAPLQRRLESIDGQLHRRPGPFMRS
jgi:hypothetical protein